MSDARTASGFDRLPWLADEPTPPAKVGSHGLVLWVVAAFLIVAGASYWIGHRNSRAPAGQAPRPISSSDTVALPKAKQPQPEVTPYRIPEVEPVYIPSVRPAPERQEQFERPGA